MVRTSRGFRPTLVKPSINTGCVPSVNTTCITDPIIPTVTADIKTNAGNVCEYWDASCKIQQGLDSINVGVIQAGEDITTWGDEVTVTIQESYVENIETPIVQGVENIQDAYVENIETPIVQGVEYVQGGIDEQIKAAQDAAAILAKNTQDAFNATIKAAQDAADKAAQDAQDAFNATMKAAQDAADAAAKAAADAAAAAGKGVVKPVTDMMMIGGVAALGLGVLLVMKK